MIERKGGAKKVIQAWGQNLVKTKKATGGVNKFGVLAGPQWSKKGKEGGGKSRGEKEKLSLYL